MRRIAKRVDGFDHILLPCDQGTEAERAVAAARGAGECGHGRHGEEWYYVVRAEDGLTALSLTVFTSRMPISVLQREDLRRHWPTAGLDRIGAGYGSNMALHAAPPLARGAVAGECEALGTGPCDILVDSFTAAGPFWEEHSVRQAEPDQQSRLGCTPDYFAQPESFWLALEEFFRRWDRRARAQHPPSN